MASGGEGIPLPLFDGEHKNFQIWWTRFKAFAGVKRFAPAITTTAEVDLPATEAAANQTNEQKSAVDCNLRAMASITMAFQTEGLMSLIYKSESTDWPSGKAHIVIDLLFKKYKLADTISRLEMRQRLNQVTVHEKQPGSQSTI